MVSLISLGILIVLAATEGAQDKLFDVNVIFKLNSSRLLEISFDRKYLFSVLDQSETNVISHECFLLKNGSNIGLFVQKGRDDVDPFTFTLRYEPCEPIQKLSISCEIELISHVQNVNAKSKEFGYDSSQGFLNYHCDKNIFYAITIGKQLDLQNQSSHCIALCQMKQF